MNPTPMGKELSMVSTLPLAGWASVSPSLKSRKEMDKRKYWTLEGRGVE